MKNSSSLFNASDYEVAPPEYHRKAVWGLWAHTLGRLRHPPLSQTLCKVTITALWSAADINEVFHLSWYSTSLPTHPPAPWRSQELVAVKTQRSKPLPFVLLLSALWKDIRKSSLCWQVADSTSRSFGIFVCVPPDRCLLPLHVCIYQCFFDGVIGTSCFCICILCVFVSVSKKIT